jgi:hypothetical protein
MKHLRGEECSESGGAEDAEVEWHNTGYFAPN